MSVLVHAVGRPELAPLPMPERFRHDIAYFMSPPGGPGVPSLEKGEYWVSLEESRRWLEEGVILVVSPLDSGHPAELELTEEMEDWLAWMIEHQVQRIRLQS